MKEIECYVTFTPTYVYAMLDSYPTLDFYEYAFIIDADKMGWILHIQNNNMF